MDHAAIQRLNQVAIVVALLGVVLGCQRVSQTMMGCLRASDCVAPLVCKDEYCTSACATSRDCGAGEHCVPQDDEDHGLCIRDVRCNYNSECATPRVCGFDGVCRLQCLAAQDCTPGAQMCVMGVCVVNESPQMSDGGLMADGPPASTNPDGGPDPDAGGEGPGNGGVDVDGGTPVQGVIASASWTAAGSPYVLTGDVTVAALTIGPGVVVAASGNFVLEVAGHLQATGTRHEPIRFTVTTSNTVGWRGIKFNSAQPSGLAFVSIERATAGAIQVVNTQLSVRNCTLKSNSAAQGGGLFVSGATSQVTVNNCTLTGNLAKDAFEAGGGIFLRDGATVIVANSIFEGNSAVAANGRGGAVFVCGGMITLTNVVLVGNGNSQFGNGSYAIAVNTGGLTGCTAGTALVSNGVLFDNVPAAVTGSGVDISYSQIDGGFSGAGNFSGNPLFSDAQYHLLEGISPCVDAGDPAAVHDDACLPPSLATARNDVGAYGGPGACAW